MIRKLLVTAGFASMLPVLAGVTAASASTTAPAWHTPRCTPVMVRVHHHHHQNSPFRLAAAQWGLMRRGPGMFDHNRREGDFRRTVLVCRHGRHEHHNRFCDPRGLQLGGMQNSQLGTLHTGGPMGIRQFCPPPCPPVFLQDTRTLNGPQFPGDHTCPPGEHHHHGRDPGHNPYPTPKPSYTHDPTPYPTHTNPYPTVKPSYTPDPVVTPSYTVTPKVTPSYTVTPTYAPVAPAAS